MESPIEAVTDEVVLANDLTPEKTQRISSNLTNPDVVGPNAVRIS